MAQRTIITLYLIKVIFEPVKDFRDVPFLILNFQAFGFVREKFPGLRLELGFQVLSKIDLIEQVRTAIVSPTVPITDVRFLIIAREGVNVVAEGLPLPLTPRTPPPLPSLIPRLLHIIKCCFLYIK